MLSILKKLTLATAAAGMLMLGPISARDNIAKADGWRSGRGWNNGYYNNGYYRRGIPGDGWRARYRSYYGPSYYGGYYQPYYGGYYGPGYSYVPWTSIYNVPGYGVNTPYFGVQVW